MRRAWLTLLYPCLVAACTNTTSLIEESYLACQLHPECSDSLYLTPAHHFWEETRFAVLVNIILDNVGVDHVTICNSSESFAVWIELLGAWDFCQKNEVYSQKSGDCVCSPDKNCDPTMYGTLGGSGTVQWLARLLLVLIMLYGGKHIFTQLDKLQVPLQASPRTLSEKFN